jgi:hypothetical protein
MEKKKVYASLQLVSALPANVLKVFMWITGWNTEVKYYSKQFSKALKMDVKEVELCIQTLINVNLIDAAIVDSTWILTPNSETNQKYYTVPLAKVIEGKGIQMATEVTWMSTEADSKATDPSEMSEDEIKRMILRLQASLNEKQQIKHTVKSATPATVDDLPF